MQNPAQELPNTQHKYPLSAPDFLAFEARTNPGQAHPVNELEAVFASLMGRPAAAVISGTAAIHLAIRLLQLGEGDEVVVPTLTFVATCNPVLYEHATPVFIDSEEGSWNLDPNALADFLKRRARINKLPRAVMAVHLFGQSADMDAISAVCSEYQIVIIEDAAESLGSLYKGRPTGTLGDLGAFSFNANKIITGTSGGMLVSARSDWVEKARFLSSQARDADPEGVHNYVHSELGYNYRLSPILADIIVRELKSLDIRVQQRRAIAFRYRDAFGGRGLTLMPQASYGLHTNWLSCFLIDEQVFGVSQRDLIQYLDREGIESRPVWKPLHTQKLFSKYESIGGSVAEKLHRDGICLPSSSSLTIEEQQFIIDTVIQAHRHRA